MKIKIYSFGKPKLPFIKDGISEYLKRLKPLVQLDEILLKEIPIKNGSIPLALKEEEKQILKVYRSNVPTFLLVENSCFYSSSELADEIKKFQMKSGLEMDFFIGSPYGFSPEIKMTINKHLSLSKMTFTHDMAYLLLLEQLYRAFTIIKGIPYHN